MGKLSRHADDPASPASPSDAGGAIGRALLLAHLVLSPLVFCSQTVDVFEYNKVAVLLLTALALAALGLASAVGRLASLPPGERWFVHLGRGLHDLAGEPVAVGVLFYLASAILSTAFSISPRTSFLGAQGNFAGLQTILAYTVLFFATRAWCRTPAQGRRLLTATVLAAAVTSTYAMVQAAHLDPVRWEGVADYGAYIRPFGTLSHAMFLGAYLVMALPVTAFYAWRAQRQRERPAFILFALLGALAISAVLLTLSRGAWLGLAALAIVPLLVWRRQLATQGKKAAIRVGLGMAAVILIVATAGVLAGPRFLDSLMDRVDHLGDAAGRRHIWEAGLAIFQEHALVGCGLDTFQFAFEGKRTPAYWLVEWNGTPLKAHCEPIQVLATQGLLGAAAVLWLVVALIRATRRALERAGPNDRPLIVALAAGLVGFCVQDLVSFTVAANGTLFVTLAALLSRCTESATESQAHPAPDQGAAVAVRRNPFPLALVFAAILGAGVLFPNLFANAEPEAPAAGVGYVLVFAAFCLASFAILRSERGESAEAAARPAAARFGVRLVQAGMWAGAAALAFVGVVQPYRADRQCHLADQLARADVSRAIRHLERAVALDPGQEGHWVKLGTAAESAARTAPDAEALRLFGRAREAFERARKLVPADAYTHANLGWLLGELARRGLADPRDAFASFDAALARDPNNIYFYKDACRTALVLGDVARARDYALRGSERYPRFAPVRALLGCVALVERRPRDAINLFTQAFQADWYGDEQTFTLACASMADALLQAGSYPQALAFARLAVERKPDSLEGRLLVAQSLERLGRREEAIADYVSLLEENPKLASARAALQRLGAKLP
jgi:O-antigen ligase/tetratricopeptide (TPR) repeat protein